MQTHFLRAEIDPLHYVERLPLPVLYSFEQFGNLCFMDLGFSRYPSEFRSIRKQCIHGVANEALNLPGW